MRLNKTKLVDFWPAGSTGLRRMMAALMLVLFTATAAWADETIYTVTIKPGEGTGDAFTVQSTTIISRADWLAGNYDQSHGCFVLDTDGKVYYVLPDQCPFTAPEGKEFDKWKTSLFDESTFTGGFSFDMASTGDFTITALYKDIATVSVTYSMPDEIEVECGASKTAFDVRVESVSFGDNNELDIMLYDGIFSCADHNGTIPFTMATDGNDASRGMNSVGWFGICKLYPDMTYPYNCQGFIRIDSGDLASAKPGNYTATLKYRYMFWGSSGTVTRIDGTISLTLTIPYHEIVLTDDVAQASEIANNDGISANVTLQGRTFYTDGSWNTLCLPFTLASLSGTPLDGFTVMELDTDAGSYEHATGLDNGTLYLNFKNASSIEAGKPYIMKKLDAPESKVTPKLTATDGTRGSNSPQQDYDKLMDRAGAGYTWRTSSAAAHCEFQASEAFSVTGYTLTSGNQNQNGDPTVWTLKARLTEDDDWTVIDSRNVGTTPGDALPSKRTDDKSYTVQQPGTYRYFRFEVEQTAGGTFMCITELALHGTARIPVNVVNSKFEGVTINAADPQPIVSDDGTVAFTGSYNTCRATLTVDAPKRGDVSGDGEVTADDLTLLTNHLIGLRAGVAAPDVNRDGAVDIADVTALIAILLAGPPDTAPYDHVVTNLDDLPLIEVVRGF